MLLTWADGTVELDEDYRPFVLLSDVAAGAWRHLDPKRDYEVRWATGEHRGGLRDRYGILQAPSFYLNLAPHQQRRTQR